MNSIVFKSEISSLIYSVNSSIDRDKFNKELKDSNLTLEAYCDRYLKNIAHKKHLRALKENELYFYKNIKLSKGTYEKIIVNALYHCELCRRFLCST